jgi:hypothetical protein
LKTHTFRAGADSPTSSAHDLLKVTGATETQGQVSKKDLTMPHHSAEIKRHGHSPSVQREKNDRIIE